MNKNTSSQGSMRRTAPAGSHWPVLTVDYEDIDKKAGYGDAIFMDIGQSTWNKDDYSVKLWRWAENGARWSRQGEELPLSRVLDLAILVAAKVTGKSSSLHEFYQNETRKEDLENYITENMQFLGPKLDELRQLLGQNSAPIVGKQKVPNIFSFATSELSQDAMFAWLLSWASPQCADYDSSLQSVAVKFVKLLTGVSDLQVRTIDVGRQWEHIDIWAEINDDIFLSIEDKTGTTIHDEQLKRYKEAVEKEYPKHKRFHVYVKTGNEPEKILRDVKAAGYRIVLRNDILKCLKTYTGSNAMLIYYRDYLEAHELATQSFKKLPVADWSWNAWEGFYKELEEKKIIDGSWGYVSNPSGGFLGAWWHWVDFSSGQMYLQFEQGDLCFKICPSCDTRDRSAVRDKSYSVFMKMAKDFPEIHKPNRFGAGQYMTIAKVSRDELFGNVMVDCGAVVGRIKEYESLIDKCCEAL